MKYKTFLKEVVERKQVSLLYKVAVWFHKNRKTIWDHEEFDYPEYATLPKKLSDQLSCDSVDWIQDRWDDIRQCKTLKQFLRQIVQ